MVGEQGAGWGARGGRSRGRWRRGGSLCRGCGRDVGCRCIAQTPRYPAGACSVAAVPICRPLRPPSSSNRTTVVHSAPSLTAGFCSSERFGLTSSVMSSCATWHVWYGLSRSAAQPPGRRRRPTAWRRMGVLKLQFETETGNCSFKTRVAPRWNAHGKKVTRGL